MRKFMTLSALPLFLVGCAGDTDAEGPTDPGNAAATVTQTVEADGVTVTETVTETVTVEPTTEEQTDEEQTDEEAAAGDEAGLGESETSSRGNLIKEIGQPAGIGDPETGEMTVTFTLTDVVADYQCKDSEFADPPQNGHFVAFDFLVETGDAASMEEVFYSPSFGITEYDLQVLDEDGVRVNDVSGSAWLCADSSETLPSDIGPNQTAQGIVVLDLPTTSGTLIYDGSMWLGTSGGWEWNF